MTEDEFRALLAIENKTLRIDKLNQASLYYIAIVHSDSENFDPRFAIGKTPEHALKNMVYQYYADN
jgi:hypothetical protein